MGLCTIKRSADFKRVRGGARCATPAFVIETRLRAGTDGTPHTDRLDCARFGFTITRKLGGAVVRNRIRRRLKHALRDLDAGLPRAGHDYVVVARDGLIDQPFEELKGSLAAAIVKLHSSSRQRGPARPAITKPHAMPPADKPSRR